MPQWGLPVLSLISTRSGDKREKKKIYKSIMKNYFETVAVHESRRYAAKKNIKI